MSYELSNRIWGEVIHQTRAHTPKIQMLTDTCRYLTACIAHVNTLAHVNFRALDRVLECASPCLNSWVCSAQKWGEGVLKFTGATVPSVLHTGELWSVHRLSLAQRELYRVITCSHTLLHQRGKQPTGCRGRSVFLCEAQRMGRLDGR
jgi:hypothetical protein